jgi:hypothetical protein
VNRGSIVNRLSETHDDSAHQDLIQRSTIAIVVEPIDCQGHFSAQLADSGRIIVASSRQPLLDSARALLNAGLPASVRIELWHRGADAWALRAPLRVAAGLNVAETPYGPKFVRHRPPAEPGADRNRSSASAFSGRALMRGPLRRHGKGFRAGPCGGSSSS